MQILPLTLSQHNTYRYLDAEARTTTGTAGAHLL